MGKNKVLVKVHPEGKYVVDLDKDIDIADLTPGARVALRNDRCGQACHSSSSSSSASEPTRRCAAVAPSLVICF